MSVCQDWLGPKAQQWESQTNCSSLINLGTHLQIAKFPQVRSLETTHTETEFVCFVALLCFALLVCLFVCFLRSFVRLFGCLFVDGVFFHIPFFPSAETGWKLKFLRQCCLLTLLLWLSCNVMRWFCMSIVSFLLLVCISTCHWAVFKMFVWSCLVVVAAHLPNQSAHNCSRIQFSTECPSKLFTSSVYIYEYSHQISVGDIALCTNDPYTPPAEHPSETRVNAAFSTRSVVGLPWLVGWLMW